MADEVLLRRSLQAVRTLRAELERQRAAAPPSDEPIAVVGMGCRFPGGADSPDRFWELLRDGRDAVVPVPPQRWDPARYLDPDPDAPGAMYTDQAGFLAEDVRAFDAEFFGISAREAADMDPQHRLLLETSWEAMERAGALGAASSGRRVGVFAGVSGSEFAMMPRRADRISPYTATGAAVSVAVGRIAHALGLRGPAVAVDTACSSSLVAVHLAAGSLRRGECDTALAGGVNVLLSPGSFVVLCKMRALAADGRCKTFDAAADGYVRGEGAGMVVLRRLRDALADNDPVLAVLRGSAVNQDGHSSGLTVPNGRAQRELVERALAEAGVRPADVGYLEAHGTGTSLGDPIEVRALAEVFAGRSTPLLVGAVKSAIGHLEAAAGVAGLIKAVLVLQHGQVPANLHLSQLNPELGADRIPARFPQELTAWPGGDRPRVAGVSSFGFSGTNAHAVLAEAPAPAARPAGPDRPTHVLALSARTPAALRELARRLGGYLDRHAGADLGDVCHTVNARRRHFAHRSALVAPDAERLAERLWELARAEPAPADPSGGPVAPDGGAVASGGGPVAFACGDGPSNPRALVAALLREPSFAAVYESANEAADADPAVAVQVALARLWESWGVRPAAVVGAGPVGARVAAMLAGDRARLVTAPLAEAAGDLAARGYRAVVDLGCGTSGAGALPLVPAPRSGTDLVEAAARLYTAGIDLDWAEFDRGRARRVLTLPPHPFQRAVHWPADGVAAPPATPEPEPVAAVPGRVLGRLLDSPLPARQFEGTIGLATLPELRDNAGVLHIGHYHEMLAGAVRELSGSDAYAAQDLEFRQALYFPDDAERVVQLVVEPADEGGRHPFAVHSRPTGGGRWALHLRGTVHQRPTVTRTLHPASARDEFRRNAEQTSNGRYFYDALRVRGFHIGPAVAWVDRVWWRSGAALARFLPAEPAQDRSVAVDPGILDACAQLFAVAGGHALSPHDLFITASIEEFVTVNRPVTQPLWCTLKLREGAPRGKLLGDFEVVAESGELVARAGGVQVQVVSPERRALLLRAHEEHRADRAETAAPAAQPATVSEDDPATYLLTAVADLVRTPAAGIDVRVPLPEYGVDSLAALELRKRIADHLGVDVPVEFLLQGPSIEQVATAVTENRDRAPAARDSSYTRDYDTDPSSWLFLPRRRPGARYRLFCIPYGVKGASLYMGWTRQLAPHIDVCPVQFPGKENRIAERPIDEIGEAVDALEKVVLEYSDLPVAIYGHSVGGLVAYRLAQRLAQRHVGLLQHLFVGAYTAPSTEPNPVYRRVMESLRAFGFEDMPDLEDIAGMPESRRAEYEEYIRREFNIEVTAEVRDSVKPVGYADFKLVHSYRHDPDEPPLQAPLTALHGDRDTFVSQEESAAWAALTTGPFELVQVRGDHFFLHPDQGEREVLAAVERHLP